MNWKQQQTMNIEETKTLPALAAASGLSIKQATIAGKQRAAFQPVQIPPPAWWAEALIPIE